MALRPQGNQNLELIQTALHTQMCPKIASDRPRTEPLTALPVSIDDPCSKVLPAALLKYGIKTKTDRREYDLCVTYGDVEHVVGKPFAIFKHLDQAGKKTKFMFRRDSTTRRGGEVRS